jgi:hypothetical protein
MGRKQTRHGRSPAATSRDFVSRLLFIACFAFINFVSLAARAQRIVLVSPNMNDAMLNDAFNRLKAELRIHQFETTVLDVQLEADPTDTLTRAARDANALASIALTRRETEATVHIWLIDRISGKATMRALQVDPGGDAASLLAIRAVDLLRASLQEYTPEEKPPADVANVDRREVPAAVHKLMQSRPPAFALHAAAMVLHERPRLGFGVGPTLGGTYRISDALCAGIMVAGPIAGVTFDTKYGSSSLRQELGWAEVRWDFFRAPRVRLGLQMIGGVLFIQAQGQPDAPLVGLSDNLWSSLWGWGVHSQLQLAPRVAIEFALRALGTAPHLGVAVNQERTTIDFPIMAGSLGLSVAL